MTLLQKERKRLAAKLLEEKRCTTHRFELDNLRNGDFSLSFSRADHVSLCFHGTKKNKSVTKMNIDTYLSCVQLRRHQFLLQRKLSIHWANEDIASEILREIFS